LTLTVALTTGQRYRAACDCDTDYEIYDLGLRSVISRAYNARVYYGWIA